MESVGFSDFLTFVIGDLFVFLVVSVIGIEQVGKLAKLMPTNLSVRCLPNDAIESLTSCEKAMR